MSPLLSSSSLANGSVGAEAVFNLFAKVSTRALLRRPLKSASPVGSDRTANNSTSTILNHHTATSVTVQTIPGYPKQ